MSNRFQVTIRKATEEDIPFVYELVRELAIYEKAENEFICPIEEYYQCFENGLIDCIVAVYDEEIVGMVLYYMNFSTWKGKMMYLEDFIVQDPFRGKGIGQMLFEAFLDESKRRDCKLVKWQVLDWNTPAIKFYEKNKAVIEREWWNGKIFLNPNKLK